MSRIELGLEGKSISAKIVLKAAVTTFRLLQELEREMTGKKPNIKWQMDVLSGFERANIVFRADEKTDTADAISKRMRGVS